jgi:cobalt/nickel transport system permease protein
MAGALFTSLQLWLSGTSPLQIVIPAMLTVHALIGLGEALITVAALTFILQTRPDLLGENSESAKGSRGWVLAGALISLAVVFLSPLASADPDGLERVAGDLGFLGKGAAAPYQLIPDYTLPVLGETSLSTIFAGLIGIAVVGAIIVLLGQGMRAKS